MIFQKKLDVHWFVVLPSIAVLALVALTMGALALFAGRTGGGQEVARNPEAVAIRYVATISALKRDAEASSDAPEVVVERALEILLSIRVPQERLDAHLASVIQLRALARAIPTMETTEARDRLNEILLPL